MGLSLPVGTLASLGGRANTCLTLIGRSKGFQSWGEAETVTQVLSCVNLVFLVLFPRTHCQVSMAGKNSILLTRRSVEEGREKEMKLLSLYCNNSEDNSFMVLTFLQTTVKIVK